MQWALDILLIVLLAATLFHAIRLERALGVLKRDRAVLEALVAAFNTSTRQAETGVERLRAAADGAGRQVARQIDSAKALKDDIAFLSERGERVADRLDALVRAARPLASEPPRQVVTPDPQPPEADIPGMPRVRSQAERDLLKALRMAR